MLWNLKYNEPEHEPKHSIDDYAGICLCQLFSNTVYLIYFCLFLQYQKPNLHPVRKKSVKCENCCANNVLDMHSEVFLEFLVKNFHEQ